MLSASRSTLSSSRWSFRALPVAATVLALASSVFGQASATPSHAAATVTTLTAEAGQATGKTILTVHVSPAPQSADDNRGSVTFLDTDSDGKVTSLGSAPVDADGAAVIKVSTTMAPGAHSVRALYSGNAGSAASASAPADITAEASATPDFTLSASVAPGGGTTLNVDAGVQGTVDVTITPVNGFNNYVSLSCAGLPLYASCGFLPSNVSLNGTVSGCNSSNPPASCSGESTMTLNTLAPSGKTSSLRHDTSLVYAFLLPGALGLLGLGFGRNRGLRMLAMLCVVGSLVAGASSCAQRYRYLNHGPSPNPGTPNGESILRIYGTSVNGALSTIKCFQITLNVKSTNTTGTAGNNLTPCS